MFYVSIDEERGRGSFFKDNNRVVGSYSYNFSKNVMFTDRNHDKKKEEREKDKKNWLCDNSFVWYS